MTLGMIKIFEGAGLLIYPLGLCSALAVFIIAERLYALRRAAVMPQDLVDAVMVGKPLMGGRHTVLARIVEFAEQHNNEEGAVKAFARLEVNRMERGVPYLDVIYAAAPSTPTTSAAAGATTSSAFGTPTCAITRPAFSRTLILSLSLRSDTRSESCISMAETSTFTDSGMSAGRHSMRISCVTMFRMPPAFLTPLGTPSIAISLLTRSFRSRSTRTKSTCSIFRETGSSVRSRIMTWRVWLVPFRLTLKMALECRPLLRRVARVLRGTCSDHVSMSLPPP